MGFFDFMKGKSTTPGINATPQGTPGGSKTGLNLSKEEAVTSLNLRKEKLTSLCMTKSNLSNVCARVAVVMDYSGSMRDLYRDGTVQATIERILPLALKFDDNGELDMWLFDGHYRRLNSITEHDFYQYVDREILAKRYSMGSTNYAPVMRDIMNKYLTEEPSSIPTLVIFVTDGDNYDKAETKNVVKESANHNIFWQFVGIGDEEFDFLKKLDELSGRPVDNTSFVEVNDINNISDERLYQELLREYPQWEEKAKQIGIM